MLVLVRGDHRAERDQAPERARARPAARRSAEELREPVRRPAGLHRPRGRRRRVLADEALRGLRGLVAGANEADCHLRGVEPGRDFEAHLGRRAPVEAGRHVPRRRRRSASSPRSRWATSSSSAPATPSRSAPATSTRTGKRAADLDGLLRHRAGADRGGRDRAVRRRAGHLLAARRWPRSTSSSSRSARRARRRARWPTASTRSCGETGLDVLYDDREASPGEKFADAELLGCPLRLTVGKRSRRGRRGRGAGAGAARRSASLPLEGAAAGGRGAVARASPDHSAGSLGPRPLRGAAAGDAARAAAAARGRSPTRSASCASRCCRCSSWWRSTPTTGATRTAAILFA